jgi:hypothetical protein
MMSGFFDKVAELLTGRDYAQKELLRLYRSSLLDNTRLIRDAEHAARLIEIRKILEDDHYDGGLGQLFAIESELWNYYDGDTAKARFWAVQDRFDRTITAASRANFEKSMPARSDPRWEKAGFVRAQALSLIDTIQNNQLVNLEREKFANILRRTLFGVGIILLSILLGLFAVAADGKVHPLLFYYGIIFFLGVLGACVSYQRRLQVAIDHNALAGDGIAELATIANNRITALSTLMIGGVFAIIVYWLVLSAAFASLTPSNNGQPGLSTSGAMVEMALRGKRAELGVLERQAENAAAPEKAAIAAKIAQQKQDIAKAELDLARINAELGSLLPKAATKASKDCDPKDPCCKPCTPSFGEAAADTLGLDDGRSVYLMLVLAFLAGFAEQLVPDALDRLSRRMGKP